MDQPGQRQLGPLATLGGMKARIAAGAALVLALAACSSGGLAADATRDAAADATTTTRLGDADPQATMAVLWMLKTDTQGVINTLDQQQAAITASTEPQFLTTAQISAQFGAPAADRQKLASYLSANGVPGSVDVTGSFGDTQMTASQINSLLGTTSGQYQAQSKKGSGQLVAPDGAPNVPAPLAGVVTDIIVIGQPTSSQSGSGSGSGPNPEPFASNQSSTTPSANPSGAPYVRTGTPSGCPEAVASGAFMPNQINTAYGVDKLQARGLKGEGVTAAIISSGTTVQEFNDFRACFPDLYGQSNTQFIYHGEQGQSGEGEVDTQAIVQAAPNLARLDFFEWNGLFAPGWEEPDHIRLISHVLDPSQTGGHTPDIFSASIEGSSEDAQPGNAYYVPPVAQHHWLEAVNRAALTGMTMLYASGDAGYYGTDVPVPNNSPYVTVVGGTNLILNTDNTLTWPGGQGVWNDQGAASGGGTSAWFQQPQYQRGTPGISAGETQRLMPDIAAFADGRPGTALNFLGGYWDDPGNGTSWSTPYVAGAVALARQAAGHKLGQLNPYLYKAAKANNGADYDKYFYDVMIGTNYDAGFIPSGLPCCNAGQYYDKASGLGSIKFDTFADFVAGNAQAAPPAKPATG